MRIKERLRGEGLLTLGAREGAELVDAGVFAETLRIYKGLAALFTRIGPIPNAVRHVLVLLQRVAPHERLFTQIA